ncbi:MAG TPA: beta-L-arabinofuranosidase domain-containing protein [Tepidisphaeraceae bacterium]|jgi:hypothetical protein
MLNVRKWRNAIIAAAVIAGTAQAQHIPMQSNHIEIVPNRAPLQATPFIHLPLGSVRPEGWLKHQLELQSAGLIESAEQIYPALQPDSGWLGGNGENWEKGPYYIRGLVALAYTLDDKELQHRAEKWINWALESQRSDGFFGPANNDDWWPRIVVLYYMRDYYEATGDPRVIPFLTNYFHYQLRELPKRPLREWAKARGGDNIDVVLWVYNLTGDSSLLDVAKLLHNQAYPWTAIYSKNQFKDFQADFHPQHNVNVSEALKFPAVCWQFTHDPADRAAFDLGVANLNRYYGRIDGQFSGSEMLTNRSSTAAIELCSDIERIMSDGISADILGDPAAAENMEKIAYNSLPAHTSAKMKQMTYYQLPNQISCMIGGHGFTQDYDNSTVPGPLSGYPCCCYNWHAGWPKFVEMMWAATSDGGLAALAYGPNHVTTTVAGGVPITITQTTDYPFKGSIALKIDLQKSAKFPLVFRIPSWADGAEIRVNDRIIPNVEPGTFHRINRQWTSGDLITLNFPMRVRTSTWINRSMGVERGPLAFSLKIKEQWKKIHDYPNSCDEYQIMPDSPWNYGLDVDPRSAHINVAEHDISDVPFDSHNPPVVLTVHAQQLANWTIRPAVIRAVVMGSADNSWHELTNTPAMLQQNGPHHLRVVARGDTFRIYVDDMDSPLITQTDNKFPVGSVGLRAYSTTAQFTDIKLNGQSVSLTNSADWQPFSGSWSVQNNTYTGSAPSNDAKTLLKNHTQLRNFTFEANLSPAAGGDAGLIIRASDLNANLDGYHGYYIGLTSPRTTSQDSEEPPTSPTQSSSPDETVQLIPYGSTKLRISYFPTIHK